MTNTDPLRAEVSDGEARPVRSRMIERLVLSAGILGLVVGVATVIRDIPEAYADGRLSSTRLSRLYEPPADRNAVALARRATEAPKLEAEALPPTTP